MKEKIEMQIQDIDIQIHNLNDQRQLLVMALIYITDVPPNIQTLIDDAAL